MLAAFSEFLRADLFDLSTISEFKRECLGPRCTQRACLRFTASFRHCFRKISEKNGEPEPNRDLQFEANVFPSVEKQEESRNRGADFGDKHHRICRQCDRVELPKSVTDSRNNNRPIKNRM